MTFADPVLERGDSWLVIGPEDDLLYEAHREEEADHLEWLHYEYHDPTEFGPEEGCWLCERALEEDES